MITGPNQLTENNFLRDNLNSFEKGISFIATNCKSLVERVGLTALGALSIFMQSFLFHVYHNLAVFGFTVGFVFNEQIRRIVADVNMVYQSFKTVPEQIAFYCLGTIIATYFLGPTVILATFYNSARLGSLFYFNCRERYLAQNPGLVYPN